METNKFPLISGQLSLDLVNTELIRRGQLHDLLVSEENVLEWLEVMKKTTGVIHDHLISKVKDRSSIVLSSLREFRFFLRKNFESIAEKNSVSDQFTAILEKKIEKAPFAYRLIHNKMVPSPLGEAEDVLISLISYDALKLIDMEKLTFLRRCSNPDCVLLFIDESGRRKWCSMKICGNRKKVSRYQHRKNEQD